MFIILTLQDYDYNLTAYQFERHSSVVEALSTAYQEAHDNIVASEEEYDGLRESVHLALEGISTRFFIIQSLLANFEEVINNAEIDFRLRSTASSLFTALNTTYAELYQLASSSQEVCSVILYNMYYTY